MRKNDTDITINVTEHIILRNFWEYYITDEEFTSGIKRALVLGYETELGDVSLSEIKPYAISRTRDLDIMPAPGWTWC